MSNNRRKPRHAARVRKTEHDLLLNAASNQAADAIKQLDSALKVLVAYAQFQRDKGQGRG